MKQHVTRLSIFGLALLCCCPILALAADAPQTQPALKDDPDPILAPTLVSFSFKDAHPKDILAEIQKQTLYDLAPMDERFWDRANIGPLSMTADKAPFWAVVREFCQKAGLTIYPSFTGDKRIMLMPGGRGMPNATVFPAYIPGSPMFVITLLSRTNAVDLADMPKINRSMMMTMQLYLEPKVKVLQCSNVPEMDEAVDDKGASLLRAPNAGAPAQPWFGRTGTVYQGPLFLNVPLVYPEAGAGEKIARLRGKVKLTVQLASETMEIPQLMKAKDVTKTVAGRKITLKDVTKLNDRQYQLTVVFFRGDMEPAAFQEVLRNPGIKLINDEGQEWGSYGGGVWGGMGGPGGGPGTPRVIVAQPQPNTPPADEQELKLNFWLTQSRPRPGDVGISEPTTLIWEITTAKQELVIPFEFTDLPLP